VILSPCNSSHRFVVVPAVPYSPSHRTSTFFPLRSLSVKSSIDFLASSSTSDGAATLRTPKVSVVCVCVCVITRGEMVRKRSKYVGKPNNRQVMAPIKTEGFSCVVRRESFNDDGQDRPKRRFRLNFRAEQVFQYTYRLGRRRWPGKQWPRGRGQQTWRTSWCRI